MIVALTNDQRIAAGDWAYSNARAYACLLNLRVPAGSEQWIVTDGYLIRHASGKVIINAQLREIAWLDLAPDDDPREWQTLRMPKVNSIGATVAVAQSLLSLNEPLI